MTVSPTAATTATTPGWARQRSPQSPAPTDTASLSLHSVCFSCDPLGAGGTVAYTAAVVEMTQFQAF